MSADEPPGFHPSLRNPTLPRIGLMMGDMTGIGPEICAKLLASGRLDDVARIVVVGDSRVLDLGCRDAGVERPRVEFMDLGNIDPGAIPRGDISPESGRPTGETLQHMTRMALAGEIDAICFAPLNKAALHRGGWKYPDEHQMFAAFTQHEGFFGEMNVIPQFSTFRVTSHVSLRKALDMVTPQRIESAVRLAHATLRANGIGQPRIGVAALNPHCGENGLFGDEEIRIIRPTVDALREQGIGCSGPVSSDVIFLKAMKGEFDGVVMMYHDQGQIATKLLGFNKGVTVTAGLKAVYTTPAHGTAFDIVGQGKADPSALEQAVRIAARLASSGRALLSPVGP
ncbi:MAG: 4-hydroxythreonine-4-phosphate dehydrogenase PdxA [Burkholderiales bacterium]|nr:4-hydroxythreonine-4-phosphate dehydrogenase PdxA [Burkholderiales bacterium]